MSSDPWVALRKYGLLLLQDARLPSLATAVAGEAIRGSWWGHPASHEIFRVAGELEQDPDVAIAKLVAGKVNFVHRPHFANLVAIGSAREPWQTKGLDAEARALLRRVDEEGDVQASGPVARRLETALLVAANQVHTASGKHALVLTAWPTFAERRHVDPGPSVAQARAQLEAAAAAMAGGTAVRMPWSSARR